MNEGPQLLENPSLSLSSTGSGTGFSVKFRHKNQQATLEVHNKQQVIIVIQDLPAAS